MHPALNKDFCAFKKCRDPTYGTTSRSIFDLFCRKGLIFVNFLQVRKGIDWSQQHITSFWAILCQMVKKLRSLIDVFVNFQIYFYLTRSKRMNSKHLFDPNIGYFTIRFTHSKHTYFSRGPFSLQEIASSKSSHNERCPSNEMNTKRKKAKYKIITFLLFYSVLDSRPHQNNTN